MHLFKRDLIDSTKKKMMPSNIRQEGVFLILSKKMTMMQGLEINTKVGAVCLSACCRVRYLGGEKKKVYAKEWPSINFF